MPKRMYVGENAGVIVVLAGGNAEVARGETVDVPVELADEMDASDAWSLPKSKDKKE